MKHRMQTVLGTTITVFASAYIVLTVAFFFTNVARFAQAESPPPPPDFVTYVINGDGLGDACGARMYPSPSAGGALLEVEMAHRCRPIFNDDFEGVSP